MEKSTTLPLKAVSKYLSKQVFFPKYNSSFTPKAIVVIPSYCEDALLNTLESLAQNEGLTCFVEVLIVLNNGLDDTKAKVFHASQMIDVQQFNIANKNKYLRFIPLCVTDISPKKAGVGMARKLGMDAACHRFSELGEDGLIICLDADCRVENDYLKTIIASYETNSFNLAEIHFEHLFIANDNMSKQERGIVLYELFLRYYRLALQFINHPQAFYTVGSSMAVKCSAYALQGGMNTRKAGEDFYFFNKMTALGKVAIISNTAVYPSARASDRVPFGTGRAIMEYMNNTKELSLTYNFDAFLLIKLFIDDAKKAIEKLVVPDWNLHPQIASYYGLDFLNKKWQEITMNAASLHQKRKRFFAWLDAFQILKILHYLRDHYFEQEPIVSAANRLLSAMHFSNPNLNDSQSLLQFLRNYDKQRPLINSDAIKD